MLSLVQGTSEYKKKRPVRNREGEITTIRRQTDGL